MRRLLLCAVLGALSCSSGCITKAGGNLDALDRQRLAAKRPSARAPAIEQTVGAFAFHLDGGKLLTSNKMGRELNDEILDRWRAAGFIATHAYVPDAQFSPASALRLRLEGRQDGASAIWLQVLSGLTLYVIPHYVDTRMALEYVLENAQTGCSFRASVEDSYRTVISSLLLPATPFGQSGREATFARIADHLYLQLAEQGAFDAATRCPHG